MKLSQNFKQPTVRDMHIEREHKYMDSKPHKSCCLDQFHLPKHPAKVQKKFKG